MAAEEKEALSLATLMLKKTAARVAAVPETDNGGQHGGGVEGGATVDGGADAGGEEGGSGRPPPDQRAVMMRNDDELRELEGLMHEEGLVKSVVEAVADEMGNIPPFAAGHAMLAPPKQTSSCTEARVGHQSQEGTPTVAPM